jgi:hypothetical protein
MNITNATYQRDLADTANIGIVAVIDGETVYVPLTTGNRHYAEIMRQVEAGELTIADAD